MADAESTRAPSVPQQVDANFPEPCCGTCFWMQTVPVPRVIGGGTRDVCANSDSRMFFSQVSAAYGCDNWQKRGAE